MKRKYFFVTTVIALAATVLLFSGVARTATAAKSCQACHPQLSATLPKAHPPVAGGDVKQCLSCHAVKGAARPLEWSVHDGHFRGARFTGNCWSCHEMGADGLLRVAGTGGKGVKIARDKADAMLPYFKSWGKSDNLDRTHGAKRISCTGCHESFFPEERASEERCLDCHKGYPAVAARTAKMKPNPHESHLGEIRCTLCHKAHEASVDYCQQCHNFGFKFTKKK